MLRLNGVFFNKREVMSASEKSSGWGFVGRLFTDSAGKLGSAAFDHFTKERPDSKTREAEYKAKVLANEKIETEIRKMKIESKIQEATAAVEIQKKAIELKNSQLDTRIKATELQIKRQELQNMQAAARQRIEAANSSYCPIQ